MLHASLMKKSKFSGALEKLGAKIRSLRKERNLSQEGFADSCGLDRTYIGGVERGERNIGFKNLLLISKTLDVTPSELIAGIVIENEDT